MAQAINKKLEIYQDSYDSNGYSSVNHIANALMHKADMLSPILTHLYGRFDRRFPLSFITEGMGRIRSVDSIEYKIPIIGRPKKHSIIGASLYDAVDQPGKGGLPFIIPFQDKWFPKSMTIMSPRGTQVRIQSEPEEGSGGVWNYKCVLANADDDSFVDPAELTAGTMWGMLFAPVGIEASRGVESRRMAPSMMTNQVTLVRKSYRYRGNFQNKVAVIDLPTAGGSTRLWAEWELFLFQLEWRTEIENLLWYGKYNRGADGLIKLRDEDSNEVIPIGSGVFEQIPNYDTYSYMTENKFKSVIRDVMFNASDSQTVNIEVFTGTGGMEEAHKAMSASASSTGFNLIDSDKFVKSNGTGLTYGNYFNTYMHQDGHKVTFRRLPMLDTGTLAEISPKHPVTGLPLDSYKMIFLDMSTYDGVPNIQYVAEKGRESIEFAVAGATVPKGYPATPLRASDIDAASVHMMKSCGVQIRRPTNCFLLECVL